jgi:hypothetical protein
LELQEYVIDEHVLSRREFDKKSQIITTSMSRNKESGYIVKMNVSRLNKHVVQPTMSSLAIITSETLRKHFDLIGQYDSTTIIFLVQNTKKEGLDILINRLKLALLKKFEPAILDQINWNIIEITTRSDLKS